MRARLYHNGELAIQQRVILSASNSHHLARVLRARVDTTVELFNGDGNHYAAILSRVDPKHCEALVQDCTAANNESPLHITLLQGLSRNDRMDRCLQKATELGVNRIVPMLCARSKYRLDEKRAQKKQQHWQQIIISACEQSGRCTLPELSAPAPARQAMQNCNAGQRLFFEPDAGFSLSQSPACAGTKSLAIVIGPESGFDKTEVQLAVELGFTAVRFGPRILRTETAGPAAIAAIQALWGDLG